MLRHHSSKFLYFVKVLSSLVVWARRSKGGHNQTSYLNMGLRQKQKGQINALIVVELGA